MKYDYLTVEEQEVLRVEYIKKIETQHYRDTLYLKELDGKLEHYSEKPEVISNYNRLKEETLEKMEREEKELTSLKQESGVQAGK